MPNRIPYTLLDTLTKYYEAIHTGKAISDIEGIYNAKAYHILAYISEKINNDEMLNGFEEDALNLIIDVMKSAQGSYKNVYSGLFSRDYFNKVLKPSGKNSGVAPFYQMFLLEVAKILYKFFDHIVRRTSNVIFQEKEKKFN